MKVQLVAALLANGWYVEGTCIHAPNGTMQLSLETEWPGGELDLLKTMQSRLSRISKRLDEQHFHSSILDTISCMDAIISLISSVEIVLRWYHFSHVLIEIIQVGDLVFSRDDVTGESSWQPVEETFVTPETELLDLELAWPGGGETLRVTSEHPIWVKGEGWVEAGSLRSGDHIASADAGGWATVQSLRGPPGKETVYNLSVAKSHTYFVGSGGTWVHNGGPCGEEELVTLWKAVPPRRTAAIAEEEVKSGFPVNRYPGMGPFFSLEKSVAEKYRYHYQNGMQEIILPKSHYDRMFSSGLIKIDGLEQSSVHVPASGLDRFNQAIQLGPANKYHPEVP